MVVEVAVPPNCEIAEFRHVTAPLTPGIPAFCRAFNRSFNCLLARGNIVKLRDVADLKHFCQRILQGIDKGLHQGQRKIQWEWQIRKNQFWDQTKNGRAKTIHNLINQLSRVIDRNIRVAENRGKARHAASEERKKGL